MSDFSTGTFDQWSWWGQGQADIWGKIAVVNPADVCIPALDPRNPHVAQMTVTSSGPADGKVNAKLYKGFGTTDRDGVEHEPADVSGSYSAWYYIPSSYKIRSRQDWANIFQFKEQYALPDGSNRSDPLWWVQLGSVSWAKEIAHSRWIGRVPHSGQRPVAFLNYWGNDWTRKVVFDTVPLNRWFEITATVDQGNRAVYLIDGKPFDVALASQDPVSPFHSTGNMWIFGVGDYSTAPGTTLYVGKASYQASPSAIDTRARSHSQH